MKKYKKAPKGCVWVWKDSRDEGFEFSDGYPRSWCTQGCDWEWVHSAIRKLNIKVGDEPLLVRLSAEVVAND